MGVLIKRFISFLLLSHSVLSFSQEYFPKLDFIHDKVTIGAETYAIVDGVPQLWYIRYNSAVIYNEISNTSNVGYFRVSLNPIALEGSAITVVYPADFYYSTYSELRHFMVDNKSSDKTYMIIGFKDFTLTENGVKVVSECYAVFYTAERGMISFIFDTNHPQPLKSCVVSTEALEKYVGIKFFTQLPSAIQVIYKSFKNTEYFVF